MEAWWAVFLQLEAAQWFFLVVYMVQSANQLSFSSDYLLVVGLTSSQDEWRQLDESNASLSGESVVERLTPGTDA